MDYLSQFKIFLDITIKEQASDLLISVDHFPTVRITGQLVPLVKEKKITAEYSQGLAASLLGDSKKKSLLTLWIRVCWMG